MDYYKVLGLEKGASDAEIKTAYRKKAKEHHPDRGGNAETFKDINEAYSVLSDSDKKSKYDRFGTTNPGQRGQSGGFDMNDIFSNFGDFFNGFGFNNQQQGRSKRQKVGKNVQTKIQVNITDVLFGCKKTVEFFRASQCIPCNGKGGTGNKTCTTCKGNGQQTQRTSTPMGIMETVIPCQTCDGSGEVIEIVCTHCKGVGATKEKHKVDVDVPPGVLHGMRMEVPHNGDYVRNGIYGSLYLDIEEVQHPSIIRDNNDIIIKADISISTAVLGGDIKVNTPHGDMNIKIESGTPGGHHFEYSNMGIPELHPNGNSYTNGDMIIITEIIIPTSISEEQKELFTKIKILE